ALEAEPANADIFAVEIILDALLTAFLAEAGLLQAAERRFRRGDQPFIYPDQAVFQAFHDTERPAEILRIEVARKSVDGVIGALDRLFLGFEAVDGRYGTEDFLLREAHFVRRIGNHGRLEERPAQRVAGTARDDPAAFFARVGDQFLDLLDGAHIDQRPL